MEFECNLPPFDINLIPVRFAGGSWFAKVLTRSCLGSGLTADSEVQSSSGARREVLEQREKSETDTWTSAKMYEVHTRRIVPTTSRLWYIGKRRGSFRTGRFVSLDTTAAEITLIKVCFEFSPQSVYFCMKQAFEKRCRKTTQISPTALSVQLPL
jgi:hypothetical protein